MLERKGVARNEFFRLVESHAIRQVLRDVYVRADVPDDLSLRTAACALVLGPDQVVVDRTAAWLHGVDTLTWAEHDITPPVDVRAAHGAARVRRQGVTGGERDLPDSDIIIVHGVRVTTPVRTALDLGRRLRRREAYAALCELARLHRLTPTDLTGRVEEFRGQRGVIQLRGLVPLVDVRYESPREAWVWLAIHDAGLPTPTPQVWVECHEGDRYRLDFAYERAKVAVEYDGEAWHSSREDTLYDKERWRILGKRGWRIITVRRGDFAPVEIERWLAELKYALSTAYDPHRW